MLNATKLVEDFKRAICCWLKKRVSPLVVYSLHLVLNGSRRPSINWSDYHQSGDIDAANIMFERVESSDGPTDPAVGGGLSPGAVSSGTKNREERSPLSVAPAQKAGSGASQGLKEQTKDSRAVLCFRG